jgi:tight adherence protein C
MIAFFTNVQNLLSLGVGVLVFATLVTLARVVRRRSEAREPDEGRGGAPRGAEAPLAPGHRRPGQPAPRTSGTTDDGFKKRVVERLNLTKLLEDPKVADKMAQAGYRGPKPLTTFYFFRFSMPFVFLAVAAFYLFIFNDFGLPVMTRVTACMVAAVVGFYAPNIFLANRISKRRTSIMQAFPDALDLLLICVEAGMSIEAAIQKVSQEIGGSSIDLAEELTLLSAELSYLPDRRMAYEGLAKRTNHPGVKSVATAMTQAETYGTPLGTALRTMAKENREMRLSAAEKKAAALPAKLTVPMILFFLPVLFIVILTPAIISIQDTMAAGAGG